MAQTKSKSTGRTTPKGGEQKVTSAKAWKSSARKPVYLELPSGNVCLALNRGLKVFMEEGKIPNSLVPIVEAAINEAQGISPKKQQEMAADPKMLGDVLQLCDAIVVSCVKSPRILPVPVAVRATVNDKGEEVQEKYVVEYGDVGHDAEGNEVIRDENNLYVDECELDDKMFVLQWVMGGVKDVEKFREEYEAAMANIHPGEPMADASE